MFLDLPIQVYTLTFNTIEDDGDAAGFMVQCESCMVWQHGPCMGFASESDAPEGDYYCERCKPEDHAELLKCVFRRLKKTLDELGTLDTK